MVGLRVSHPRGQNAFMINLLPTRAASETNFSPDDTADCPLWGLCESLADDFVRACLNADDTHDVRRTMERDICAMLDFEPARAEALLELVLEVLHLRSEGRYRSEVTEVAYLIALVSGSDDTLCLS